MMRGAWTVAWKDFRVLVASPMFLMVAGLCACIWSYNFLPQIFQFERYAARAFQSGGGLNIHQTLFASHLARVNIILIFAIPALTMRLLAEEKKLRTYDLLLTVPITAAEISLGKFLAAFGAGLALISISFLYPLITLAFADFSLGPLMTSYLGMALIMGIYVAVGLFASSVTESVVLAVVMALILNLALWFLGQAAEMTDQPEMVKVLEHISVPQQFVNFMKGTLKVSSLLFFASAAAFFVFLTERVVESSRWR
ncbi:MAG: ABC transporter permease subunit [Bdellovibrionales bacterium]|nr:ABC transporter permease subunit [Bdellovibrionales bacterium]